MNITVGASGPWVVTSSDVIAGCFVIELKGSRDNGLPPDPWMLRCTYQIRPAELQRALRKLRIPARRAFWSSNRILGPVPRHASPINSTKAPDLWTPPLRHVAKKYRLCRSADRKSTR